MSSNGSSLNRKHVEMLEKCPKKSNFRNISKSLKKKKIDWTNRTAQSGLRLSFVTHVHIVSTDESLIEVVLDEADEKNSASTTRSNTIIWNVLSTSARLTLSATDFTYAHGCTEKNPRYISSRLIWARHLAQVAFLELLKTLFNTFEISPSYRSLHSCLSNAFPSLPRHSLPLNFGIVKEKLCNSSSFHISAQEL